MGIPNLVGHYRDGLFRRKVVTISTASTGYNPSFEQSGSIFVVGSASTQMIRLPRISSKHLGIAYEFLVVPQSSAADVNIVTNLDSSARIYGVGTSGSTGNAAQSIRPDTTQVHAYGRLTALSTVIWFFEQSASLIVNSSGELHTTQIGTGVWSTGSTST